MEASFDVIVVGGGPAGSSAARRAAQQGARVLLLDANTFPRAKPCGGALSEQAMSYLDFTVDERLVHAEVFGARVHFEGHMIEARKPFRIAVLTRRSELDHFLLGKAAEAGAQIMEGIRVTHVEQETGSVLVHTQSRTFRSRYVIGADGAQSMVAKAVRPRLPRTQYAVTYEFDVPCLHGQPPAVAAGFIDVYFGSAYMGYRWVFPKRDHWNIGVGALASRADNVKVAAQDFFGELKDLPRDVDGQPNNSVGWVVPAGGYRRPVGNHRVLLAGDAAGFVDPFYGEGIAYAILSGATAGTLAGIACTETSVRSAVHVQRRYAWFCRKAIDLDLWYGLWFARLLHAWPGGLLRLFSTDRGLIEQYLEIPAARLTYRQYFRWFFSRAIVALGRMPARSMR